MFNVRARKCVRHQSTYSRNVGIYSIVDVNLHARPQFSRINSCACASQWPVQQDSVGLITHLGNHAGAYRSLWLVRWYSMCLTTIFERSLFAHVNDYGTCKLVAYLTRFYKRNHDFWMNPWRMYNIGACRSQQHVWWQSIRATTIFLENSCACANQWPVQQDSICIATIFEEPSGAYRILYVWPWFLKRSPCCMCNTSACGS